MAIKAGVLIERGRELEALAESIDSARRGDGSLTIVEGPPGIGKTRLLEAARAMATDRGFTTVRARGGELERDFAFGVVRQLFERALADAPAEERERLLAGPAEGAVAPVLGSAGDGHGADPGFRAMHGLYWLVVNLTAASPLMIEIDDLHWADPPTLRFLTYLGARLEGVPALILAGSRGPEASPSEQLVTAIGAERAVRLVRPEPLTDEGVAELAASGFGIDPTEELVSSCASSTGGNPFYLRELLSAMLSDGGEPSAERARALGPETVSNSILLRLSSLPAGSGELARAVAVLGAEAELGPAATLAGIDPDEAGEIADGLGRVAVLEAGRPLRFTHPIVREAMYADTPSSERARLHAMAARTLERTGAEPSEIAPHLLATEPSQDPYVVAMLRRAARAALEQGATDAARRALERALAEPPVDEELADVRAELGEAILLAADDPAAAIAHLAAGMEQSADPDRRAERALMLARARFYGGDIVGAFALLEREIGTAADADADLVMRLEAELGSIGILHPPTAPRAIERLERFIDLPGKTPAELLQLANLAAWRWISSSAAETAAVATLVLEDERLVAAEGSDSIPVHEAVWVLAYADGLELSSRTLDLALADAQRRSSVFGYATTRAMRALVALIRGAVSEAEAEARAGMVPPGLPAFVHPSIHAFLTLALVERGDLEGAEEVIDASWCGPDLPDVVHMNPAFYARGRLRQAQGRHEEAIADFLELGRRDTGLDVRNSCIPWRLGAAVSMATLGRGQESAALVDDHMVAAEHWGTDAAIGSALHAKGIVDDDPQLLSSAVERLERSPAALEHARALVDLGAALRRGGKRAEARGPLREGLEAARKLGATALVERAHEELVTAGARPRRLMFSGVEALTASERRVADMAAAGQSNREIAQSLFVTVKTVENHLTRAYGKLGIGGRAALLEALQGE